MKSISLAQVFECLPTTQKFFLNANHSPEQFSRNISTGNYLFASFLLDLIAEGKVEIKVEPQYIERFIADLQQFLKEENKSQKSVRKVMRFLKGV